MCTKSCTLYHVSEKKNHEEGVPMQHMGRRLRMQRRLMVHLTIAIDGHEPSNRLDARRTLGPARPSQKNQPTSTNCVWTFIWSMNLQTKHSRFDKYGPFVYQYEKSNNNFIKNFTEHLLHQNNEKSSFRESITCQNNQIISHLSPSQPQIYTITPLP